MMNKFGMIGAAALLVLLLPMGVFAHCDTMEGPVVTAATQALETGDVDKVLIWVQPGDEQTVREAFEHTRQVRALSPEAAALADRYFFETLVRLHRAGEGAPYTGLKDEMDPAEAHFIRAGDAAIASGDDTALRSHVTSVVDEGLAARFAEVNARKDFQDVEQGREYVESYVTYLHYVEGVVGAAEGAHGDAHQEPSAEQHLASPRGWWKFWK